MIRPQAKQRRHNISVSLTRLMNLPTCSIMCAVYVSQSVGPFLIISLTKQMFNPAVCVCVCVVCCVFLHVGQHSTQQGRSAFSVIRTEHSYPQYKKVQSLVTSLN